MTAMWGARGQTGGSTDIYCYHTAAAADAAAAARRMHRYEGF